MSALPVANWNVAAIWVHCPFCLRGIGKLSMGAACFKPGERLNCTNPGCGKRFMLPRLTGLHGVRP